MESRIEKQLGIVNHILRREDGKTKISMKRRSGWRKQSEKHMDRNRLEQEKETREIEETSVSGAFEICVSCGKQTDIPREMDISERSFYMKEQDSSAKTAIISCTARAMPGNRGSGRRLKD